MTGRHPTQRHYFKKGDIAYFNNQGRIIKVVVLGTKFIPQIQTCDEVYVQDEMVKEYQASSVNLYLDRNMARIAVQPYGKRIWYHGSPKPNYFHSARMVRLLKSHHIVKGRRHSFMFIMLDNGKQIEAKNIYLSPFEIKMATYHKGKGKYQTVHFSQNNINAHAFTASVNSIDIQSHLN